MFCPSVFDVQLSLSVFPFAASAQWLVADHSASLPVVAGGPKTAGGARAVRHHGWQRLPWTKSIRKEALSVVLKSAKSRGKMRRWSKSVDLYRTYDNPIGSRPRSSITPAFDRLHRACPSPAPARLRQEKHAGLFGEQSKTGWGADVGADGSRRERRGRSRKTTWPCGTD